MLNIRRRRRSIVESASHRKADDSIIQFQHRKIDIAAVVVVVVRFGSMHTANFRLFHYSVSRYVSSLFCLSWQRKKKCEMKEETSFSALHSPWKQGIKRQTEKREESRDLPAAQPLTDLIKTMAKEEKKNK